MSQVMKNLKEANLLTNNLQVFSSSAHRCSQKSHSRNTSPTAWWKENLIR